MAEKVKKPKSKARKIISWIITGVFGVLIVGVLTVQIIGNVTKKDNYGVPNFAGNSVLVVQTDSMEYKDDPSAKQYLVGTAVFSRKVDYSTIQIGDDLTFYYDSWGKVVTHRVTNIEIDEDSPVGDGRYIFTTHGINNKSEQGRKNPGTPPTPEDPYNDCTKQYQTFTDKYVIGKVMGSSMFVGKIYSFVSSIWGLLILVLIPVLYLVVTFVIDICKTIKEPDEETSTSGDNANASSDLLANMSEEDKKRLKEEMLNELLKGKDNEGK